MKEEEVGKKKTIEFISQKLLKLEPGLELGLFKRCCEQKQNVRTAKMLDRYDEISPFYKQTVKIRSTDPFKTSSSNYFHKNSFVMCVIKKGIEKQKFSLHAIGTSCYCVGLRAGIHAERDR